MGGRVQFGHHVRQCGDLFDGRAVRGCGGARRGFQVQRPVQLLDLGRPDDIVARPGTHRATRQGFALRLAAQHDRNVLTGHAADASDGALEPDYAGIRIKVQAPGQPMADFQIVGPNEHEHRGLVLLMGIESPGLTASLAMADMVAHALQESP